jgi:uncharacterized surface protein with fasciclin (FAS1) repeats
VALKGVDNLVVHVHVFYYLSASDLWVDKRVGSTIMTSGLKTLQGGYITFRCKFNGNYINDAKVLAEDVISSNGVVHLIDQVLLPDCNISAIS